jgi:mannitol-specific phosphotransferase system IIBC component
LDKFKPILIYLVVMFIERFIVVWLLFQAFILLGFYPELSLRTYLGAVMYSYFLLVFVFFVSGRKVYKHKDIKMHILASMIMDLGAVLIKVV